MPLARDPNSPLSGQQPSAVTRRTALGLALGAPLLSACSSVQQTFSQLPNPFSSQAQAPAGPQDQPAVAGNGQVKVGLILPVSAAGNAGVAAQSMRNAAEMALAEFQNPNIQLLIKDDGGNPQGAQQGAQTRSISVIAFSTDSSVAGRGVYLLSFLPESDVNRIVEYSASIGKKSFAAMMPDNAYGNVVEVAFRNAASRRGGRVVAFAKYGADRATPARNVAQQ